MRMIFVYAVSCFLSIFFAVYDGGASGVNRQSKSWSMGGFYECNDEDDDDSRGSRYRLPSCLIMG